MNDLIIFNNEEFCEIRTIMINDEPWFVGKDVASALGYSAERNAIAKHVDNEDKLTHCFDASGQKREMIIINESGLYSLIMSSKLKKAKQFKHWVISEVIPSIMKTGSYSINDKIINQIQTDSQTATLEVKATLDMANLLEKEWKLEQGIARAFAIKVQSEHYKVLTSSNIEDFKKLLPPMKDNNIANLTPTKIAEEINNRNLFEIQIKAKGVNKALENLGYQTKENKDWKITKKAENFANMFPYENNNHTGYQIRWKPQIIDVLIEYFNDLY